MRAGRSWLFSLPLLVACSPLRGTPVERAAIESEPVPILGFQDGEPAVGAVHDARDVRRLCDQSLRALTEKRDALRALIRSRAEDERVVEALLALDATARTVGNTAFLVAQVHRAREARLEAAACGARIDAFESETPRGDVLERLSRTKGRNASEVRYLAGVVDEARRSGAALAPAEAASVAELDAKMASLQTQMRDEIARSTDTIRADPAGLRGLPPSFLDAHPADDAGTVALTTESTDVLPVLRFAEDRSLARTLFRRWRNRAYPANVPLLHELLDARRREAAALGYPSWADLCAAPRMVGTRARTVAFLDDLRAALEPVNARYRASLGLAADAPAPAESDSAYLEERAARAGYGVDAARLSEYFEANRTLHDTLAVLGEVMGLRFEEVRVAAWSPDVVTFDVRRDSGALIGRLYFDLFARPGKPTNAGSSIPFVPRTLGTVVPVRVAILTNFTPPSPSGPSLVTPEQLSTLLHETGHAIHYLLTPSGSAFFKREFDFFDVPSQVMEVFADEPEFLERVGRHYRTGERLPHELATSLRARRPFRLWQALRRDLVLGYTDVSYHSASPPADTSRAYAEAFESAQPYSFDRETHPDASLVLPTLAYDGNGHALAWGLAIATDVAGELEARGFFARATWLAYEDDVLAQDGPAEERVTRLLGRRWSTARLRASLGDLVFAGPAQARR